MHGLPLLRRGVAWPRLTGLALSAAGLTAAGADTLSRCDFPALTAADTDPYRLRNWIRMGITSSLLSLLLMAVIDFVIRHV